MFKNLKSKIKKNLPIITIVAGVTVSVAVAAYLVNKYLDASTAADMQKISDIIQRRVASGEFSIVSQDGVLTLVETASL